MNDEQEYDGVAIIQEQPKTEIYWGMRGHLIFKQSHNPCSPVSMDECEPVHLWNPLLIPELIHGLQGKWREYCEEHDLPLVPDATASLPPLPMPTASPKKKRGPP